MNACKSCELRCGSLLSRVSCVACVSGFITIEVSGDRPR